MAVPFLNSITLNKNEVQDFKVYNIGTGNPTLSSGGDIGYFWTDTTGSKVLKWWDGSAVRTILDSSSSVTATNISGGAAGELLYQSGLATTAKLAVGTDGYILTYDGTNTKPKWSASIPAGSVSGLAASATTDTTNAANISSGLLPLARLALATGQFYVGDASNNPAATAKSSISLTGFGALTADLDIAGFNIINSGNVTSGSSGSTLATKGYVDSVAQGLDIKASCLVASTADINLSAPGSGLIDGIDPATFTSGTTRILVKDQSLSQQNGIYIWNGTGSAMTRSLDANTWDELVGAFTFIEEGTANADSGWVCTANAGGTLGTTPVPFVKFSQAGSYTAGNGMVLSGGVFHFAQDTNYTAGRIPFASGNTTIGFSSNLFWDNTNSRLGIGTAPPAYPLDISASKAVSRLTSSTGTNGAFSFFSNTGGAFYIGLDNSAGTEFSAAYSGAIWHSGAYPIVFATSNAEKMRLDSSGNLGLSVTPSAWGSSYKAIQIGQVGSINYKNFTIAIGGNYYNDGTNDVTLINGYRSKYEQNLSNGTHIWYQAGIGTGNVSWNQSMTLDASGKLTVAGNLTYQDAIKITNGRMKLGHSDGGAGIWFNTATVDGKWFTGLDGDRFRLYSTAIGSDAIAITDSGITLFKANGTASAPTIANADDTNTGLYWPTDADTLALAVGGSDAVYIDSSRNVGIGVSIPITRLDVNKSSQTAGGTTPSGGLVVKNTVSGNACIEFGSGTPDAWIQSRNTTAFAFYTLTLNPNGGQIQIGETGTASTPAIALKADPDTGLYWPSASNTLALAVGGSDAVYINSGGNVSIGDSVNGSRLRIVGTNTADGPSAKFLLSLYNSAAQTSGVGSGIGFGTNVGTFNATICTVEGIKENGTSDNYASALKFTTRVNGGDMTERLRIKSTGQINLTGLAADPTGAAGDLYYSTGNVLKMHNGTAWQQLSRKYTVALNDGSVTVAGNAYTITHNMGSQDITVSVRRTTDNAVVLTDVSMPNNTTAIITFAAAITASQYVVTVIG